MTGFNFSITSKTLLNKDIIATINDAVKGFEKKKMLSQFVIKPYISKSQTS